ncbi:hypothetical protein ACLOJK_010298 [Asimina triloba]
MADKQWWINCIMKLKTTIKGDHLEENRASRGSKPGEWRTKRRPRRRHGEKRRRTGGDPDTVAFVDGQREARAWAVRHLPPLRSVMNRWWEAMEIVRLNSGRNQHPIRLGDGDGDGKSKFGRDTLGG